jgi:L-ascorbate metabolism protein UlaG (beta-lactamase superfamily)
MRITKLGHCCLVLEIEGLKIMTDPGMFSVDAQTAQEGIDLILITHEHADHLHIPSVHTILERNPDAHVVCNQSVAALLKKEGIESTHIGDGESAEVKGVKIEGFGHEHGKIYDSYGLVENTGYLVGGKFYFAGDAFYNPKRHVEVLAVPVYAPWMRIADAIDFALAIKPKIAFSVHDAPVDPDKNFGARVAEHFLTAAGIKFHLMRAGDTIES